MDSIFWKDGWNGTAKGGLMFRAFDLNKFINNLEIKECSQEYNEKVYSNIL